MSLQVVNAEDLVGAGRLCSPAFCHMEDPTIFLWLALYNFSCLSD